MLACQGRKCKDRALKFLRAQQPDQLGVVMAVSAKQDPAELMYFFILAMDKKKFNAISGEIRALRF